MKINWKMLVAAVVMVAALVWVINSVRARSYSGTNLTFPVGGGVVTVTNPSDQPVSAQLVGSGSRTFTVASDGTTGTSTREGSGRATIQTFELISPPGTSTFTVVRGSDLNYTADSDVRIEAYVEPLNANDMRSTLIGAVIVILGGLVFIYRTWQQDKRDQKRRAEIAARSTQPVSAAAARASSIGRDGRAYSDS